jgi:hypothetical protein
MIELSTNPINDEIAVIVTTVDIRIASYEKENLKIRGNLLNEGASKKISRLPSSS